MTSGTVPFDFDGLSGRRSGPVDLLRRDGLADQVAHRVTDVGRIPATAAVDRGTGAPTVCEADLAALDLEHPPGHVLRLLAAQPGDERGDVRGVHHVEA